MTALALLNPKVLVAGTDLGAWTNEASVAGSAKDLVSTVFTNAGWEGHTAGLRMAKIDLKGFFGAGGAGFADDELFADVGVGGLPVTLVPQGATDGNVAYFLTAMQPDYVPLTGKVGDLLSFSSSAVGDAPLIRGQLGNSVARTATGTGTGLQLTAPTATQRVWASLHVVSVTGTGSITVSVQGATANTFASPTTVATFTAATAIGGQLAKGTIGVTSNTWYRLSWTISGFTSVTFYGAIGVA